MTVFEIKTPATIEEIYVHSVYEQWKYSAAIW